MIWLRCDGLICTPTTFESTGAAIIPTKQRATETTPFCRAFDHRQRRAIKLLHICSIQPCPLLLTSAIPFNLLAIRQTDVADDSRYPVPSEEHNGVVLEEADGLAPWSVQVNGVAAEVSIGGTKKEVGRFADLKAALIVTEARAVFACSHYKNGGLWIGLGGDVGQVLTGIGDAISRKVAHASTKGNALVGQVRFDWLHGIIARDRKGWLGGENSLQFVFVEPAADLACILRVQFERRVQASGVAEKIVPQWMKWLASQATEEDKKQRLLANAARPQSTVVANTGARTYRIPIT